MNKLNSVNAAQSIAKSRYIIGSFTEGQGASISQYPVMHNTSAEARAECQRLSRENLNKVFFYMRIDGGEYIKATPTKVSF